MPDPTPTPTSTPSRQIPKCVKCGSKDIMMQVFSTTNFYVEGSNWKASMVLRPMPPRLVPHTYFCGGCDSGTNVTWVDA